MFVAEDQTSWVVLAHLLRPQGRRGEVLAELLTDFPDRFCATARLFLASPGFSGPPSDARAVEVASSWLPHGRNAGRIVLGFVNVSSIEEAERLAGQDVVVPEQERLPLSDDSVYINDLLGCTVYDRDVAIGTVRDVQFMTTADGKRRLEEAAPLLTVELVSGEALIPFVKQFLVRLDVAGRAIWMDLPQGLLDLDSHRTAASD